MRFAAQKGPEEESESEEAEELKAKAEFPELKASEGEGAPRKALKVNRCRDVTIAGPCLPRLETTPRERGSRKLILDPRRAPIPFFADMEAE